VRPSDNQGAAAVADETAIAVSHTAGRLFEAEATLFLLALNATLGFAHERSSKRVVELLPQWRLA
jgi:hypothetical protein